MSLKNSKAFKALMFVLIGLAFLSFALRALQKVMTGHAFDTYLTSKGFLLNYWSAVAVLVAALIAAMVALVIWVRRRLKNAPRA